MAKFTVTPHPSEAQVLQGQNLARTLYTIGAEGGEGSVPVFLGVVMDKSGSMEGQKIYNAKEALLRLLHRVPPTDDVVVHISLFSTDAHELFSPMTGAQLSQRMEEMSRRIQGIRADGATSMGRGLRVSHQAAGYYPQHERRILMITDGMQQGEEPIQAVYNIAQTIADSGARIDAWGVGHDWDADELRNLAHITGGEADVVPDAHELADAVADLFEDVQTTKATNVRLLLLRPRPGAPTSPSASWCRPSSTAKAVATWWTSLTATPGSSCAGSAPPARSNWTLSLPSTRERPRWPRSPSRASRSSTWER
jgi:Ca-activated chloride channel family protein